MRRIIFSIFLLIAASFGMEARAQDRMVLDRSHFYVGFEVEHFGFSRVVGRFNDAAGELQFDAKNPAASKLKVTVKTASIDTNFKARDEHLRKADYFDVEKHPNMVFEATSAAVTGDKAGTVNGNLTIKGVTKPITLQVRARDSKPYPIPAMKGLLVAAFEATGKVNREDFGLGKGDAILVLRADFAKCEGAAADTPVCKNAR